MNVLITGAGRGIGLGFARYYLKQNHTVYACYRTESESLAALAEQYSDLNLLHWDVSHPASDALLMALPDKIDLLINNAGIYGPMKGGQSLQNITAEAMHEVFDINCVAPLRVVQTLLNKISRPGGVIANISSKMGSSADNSSGGTYAYRAAKAALVNISRSMAVDLQIDGIDVISLHPGWVRTDMVGLTGLIDVSESVEGMAAVLENVENYEPGAFVAFDGQIVPF